MAESFEGRKFVGRHLELRYQLLAPAAAAGKGKLPLVVFLHGAGERGDDNLAQLKWCVKDFAADTQRAKHPCWVAVPQCPADQQWFPYGSPPQSAPKRPAEPTPSLGAVLELTRSLLANRPIDPARIYLMGLSMGGYGTWDALARAPELFAAAVPICGAADAADAERVKNVPVWAFHGAKDDVVPVQGSRGMVAALKAAGARTVKYTEYPDVGHNSWTPAFKEAELLPWVFAQRRGA